MKNMKVTKKKRHQDACLVWVALLPVYFICFMPFMVNHAHSR